MRRGWRKGVKKSSLCVLEGWMMNDRCRTKIVTERFGNELLICFFGFWQKSVTIILPSGTHWTDLYWSCTEWKYTPLIRQNRKLAAQFPSRLIEILQISFFLPPRGNMCRTASVCVSLWLRMEQDSMGAAGLMESSSSCLSRAHLSAPLWAVRLHHTERLTSRCHKTWQQLIWLHLWSPNPICEILALFSVSGGSGSTPWGCFRALQCWEITC